MFLSETKLDKKTPYCSVFCPFLVLGTNAVIPPLLPCAPSSSLSFSEGGKNPHFSTNAIPFFLFCGSQHVPAGNLSCHWCGRLPAGSGRELHPPSAFLLQPSPTSPWPGCQDWCNWELQAGSRQPASLRGCSHLCLVLKTFWWH